MRPAAGRLRLNCGSNRLDGDFNFGNGYNWLVRDLPQLVEEDIDTVLMLQGTRGAMWFDLIGGQYSQATNKLIRRAATN